jgi:hypothetical protein
LLDLALSVFALSVAFTASSETIYEGCPEHARIVRPLFDETIAQCALEPEVFVVSRSGQADLALQPDDFKNYLVVEHCQQAGLIGTACAAEAERTVSGLIGDAQTVAADIIAARDSDREARRRQALAERRSYQSRLMNRTVNSAERVSAPAVRDGSERRLSGGD